MSYTPTPVSKDVRNGILHVVVEFRKDGAEPVRLAYRSDDLSGAGFPQWCKRKVDQLNAEAAAVVVGEAVDLSQIPIPIPPTEPTKAEKDFSEAANRYRQLNRLVNDGIRLPQVLADELATVKAQIEMVLETRPNLSKRY